MFSDFHDSFHSLQLKARELSNYENALAAFPADYLLHYLEARLDNPEVVDLSICYSSRRMSKQLTTNQYQSALDESTLKKITQFLVLGDNAPEFIWFEKDDCNHQNSKIGLHATLNLLNIFTPPRSIADAELACQYQQILQGETSTAEHLLVNKITALLGDTGKIVHISSLFRQGESKTKYHLMLHPKQLLALLDELNWSGDRQCLNQTMQSFLAIAPDCARFFVDLSSSHGQLSNYIGLYLCKHMSPTWHEYISASTGLLQCLGLLEPAQLAVLITDMEKVNPDSHWLDFKISISLAAKMELKFYFAQRNTAPVNQ